MKLGNVSGDMRIGFRLSKRERKAQDMDAKTNENFFSIRKQMITYECRTVKNSYQADRYSRNEVHGFLMLQIGLGHLMTSLCNRTEIDNGTFLPQK